MNFSNRPRGWRDRLLSWTLVVAVHLGLGWAVLRGAGVGLLPDKLVAVEVRLIEAAPPPAQAPAPRPTTQRPAQAVVPARPRPAPPTPAPVPAVVSQQPPEVSAPAPDAGPSPTSPVLNPAPAPATVAGPPATVAIGVVCPTLVKPVMPRRAEREGLQGVVNARITLKAGKVIRVDITQARPAGVFDAAVREAVQQYRCETPGDIEVVATQVFEFKLEGE